MAAGSALFRKWDARMWLNLGWILLAVFYALFTVESIATRGLFQFVGADYAAFRCSAQIAWTEGFDRLYDVGRQRQCQNDLFQAYIPEPLPLDYEPAPLFYLPAFVPFFMLFLPFPPVLGFVLWDLLNAVVLLLYLRRFMRALGARLPGGIAFKVLLSAPVFGILFFGQVSVFLLISVGEFFLASMRGRDLRGGLWLGGLLLKPQTLILLLPGLLVGRRLKILAGFAAAALVLLLVSLSLAGAQGIVDLGELLLDASGDMATTNPHVMMNWRSLATNLVRWIPRLPAEVAWGSAIAGMALTAGVGLSLWFRPSASSSLRFALVLLGTYAATGAVTWHSHTNLAVPLVALLLFLDHRGALPRLLLDLWLLVPALVFPVAVFLIPGQDFNLVGLSLLAFNLYLVVWAAKRFWAGAEGAL